MGELLNTWQSLTGDPAHAGSLSIAIAGLFIAGVVKGTTGIGYASCALPFLATAIGLKAAMGLVIVPAMASNAMLLFTAGHLAATITRFWTLYVAIIAGVGAGSWGFTLIDQAIAAKLLGGVILLYGLQTILQPGFALGPRGETLLKVPTGFLNGLITGLTGSQVIPLVPYMIALRLKPSELVQGNNVAIIISSLFLGVGLLWSGVVAPGMLVLSCLAVIPALVGVQIGAVVRGHIHDRHFRTIVVAVLMLLGVTLIVR